MLQNSNTLRRFASRTPSSSSSAAAPPPISRLSIKAFRTLLKTGADVSDRCGLASEGGLVRYLSGRFRVVAERNRVGGIPGGQVKLHAAMVGKYCDALLLAPGNDALTSMLRALSAGVGSSIYQRSLEKGYVNYVSFDAQKEDRRVVDDEMTAERQNRMLQAAVLPYIERLQLLHENSGEVGSIRNAFGSTKAGTSVHVFSNGDEEVVAEIDEELNKQTIFIKCPPFMWPEESSQLSSESDKTNADSGSSASDGVIEDVEVCEADSIKGTTLHADWNSTATRIYDSLLESAPIHRSRNTVIIGHGIGGAVSLVVGMMLETEGFTVKNTVAFGSPRVIQDTPMSVVRAINPIRVMQSGDPLVEVPTTTSERQTFIHIGESLLVDSERNLSSDYSVVGYATALKDMNATLLYSEGDDDLSMSMGGGPSSSSSSSQASSKYDGEHGTPQRSFDR